jgi:hypothetical protein
MIASNYDITLDRAAFFTMSLTVYGDDNAVVPLPFGVAFYADIRDKITKKEITQFEISLATGGLDGKVLVELPEAKTKLLTARNTYEYDLFMVLEGKTSRLLEGGLSVRNNITNNV